MKYLYWVGVALVIGVGVWLTTLVEPQPSTKSVFPFGQYDAPEDFGKQIFTALQAEVKNAPIVLLGVTPNQVEDMEVWRGFMLANQEPGVKYEVIAVEPMLPYVELFESNLRFNIRDDMPRFVEGVKKALSENMRVAVIVPHMYSSQILRGNPADRLRKEFQLPILSLSISKFPVTAQQAEFFDPPCVLEESKDPSGLGPLGCAIRHVAKKTYNKKFEDNKYSGILEKLSDHDYLILFNRNAGSR